ncbi:MAG: M28 family metallopeptidase, partial [Candidatus Hermodarchaeota archaeon]
LFFIFRVVIMPFLGFLIFVSALLILDFVYYRFNQYIFDLVIISSLVQFIIIIVIVLLVYEIQNSYGAIDNASGVSILIELAKELNRKPLENIDVLFLWTGAEEWGNKGSNSFYKEHKKELMQKYDLNNSCYINIDMVGTYIGLINKIGIVKKKEMNANLNKLISESANELHIPLVEYPVLIEPRSDQRVFRKFKRKNKEFQIAFFHSFKDSKYIHSSKDAPDKCSVESLKGCVMICYNTLIKMDLQMDSI